MRQAHNLPKGFSMLNGLETIEGLTPEQLEAINKLAGGLVSKNGDVIGTNTILKEQVKQLEQAALDAQRKIAEEAGNTAEMHRLDIEAATKNLTTAQEKALLLETSNTELKGNLTKLLIDGGLSDALDGVRVNSALKVGAVALLRANAILSDGKAMIGDKSLSDAVKEWAASDAGKSYCLAADNSNGDGNGGGGGGRAKSFAEMTMTEKTVLANTDPTLYNQLKG